MYMKAKLLMFTILSIIALDISAVGKTLIKQQNVKTTPKATTKPTSKKIDPKTLIGKKISLLENNLREALIKLWVEHVVWTHEYILAAIKGSPDKALVATRLLKNQEDLGNAFEPYYGKDAAKKLTGLLKEHILIAADLISAAKAKDTNKANELDDKWHKNAEDIANLLEKANPKNYPIKVILPMLNEHLLLTKNYVGEKLNKNYPKLIELYDEIITQIIIMSGDLATGLVKQFPNKFK